jgi:hypothetical protein
LINLLFLGLCETFAALRLSETDDSLDLQCCFGFAPLSRQLPRLNIAD